MVLENYLQWCQMSEEYFKHLLFQEPCRALPTPSSIFKIALFSKPVIYLLKCVFSSMLLQNIAL